MRNKTNAIIEKPLIAGNWKMNILPSEGLELAIGCARDFDRNLIDLLICPPFTHLAALAPLIAEGIALGAQNCSHEDKGAFTGDISCAMLKDLQCKYVIIGHSERRANYPEESVNISQKLRALVENDMIPIYCCGEGLEARNAELHFEAVANQLEQDLFGLEKDLLRSLVVAYEPVWAIGTGLYAKPEQAREMHLFIKKRIFEKFGLEISRIIYGGSVNASNAENFAIIPEINGVLVGGASLNPKEFKAIIAAFS